MALEELFEGLVVEVDKLLEVEKVMSALAGLCFEVREPRKHVARPNPRLFSCCVFHLSRPLLARVPEAGEVVPLSRDLSVGLLGDNVNLAIEKLEPIYLLEGFAVHNNLRRRTVRLVRVLSHGERGDGDKGIAVARHCRKLLQKRAQSLVVSKLAAPLGLAHALFGEVSLKLHVHISLNLLLRDLTHSNLRLLALLLFALFVSLLLLVFHNLFVLSLGLCLSLAPALCSLLLVLHLGCEREGGRERVANIRR
mmetsp:Transcript_20680/g.40174  ORF Transcript_20680/g.40174 Transcript_20680/m.40174 type:complete len:252 (+) Transcript_20680:1584-2339(+)